MERVFVGFGFGPIQAGLFLLEASRSGNFDRFVVAEIDAALVASVRAAGGRYVVNVAWPDGIEEVTVEGVELRNPTVSEDRAALVEAIGEARELATALPSVGIYGAGDSNSVAQLLAEGCRPGAGRIIYAAENNNRAAEILHDAVAKRDEGFPFAETAILNTVIGKMSQVVADPAEMRRLNLAALGPGLDRAILVERFNRILVSRVSVSGLRRGIAAFEEKEDLLPFEEAKLYGHNAIHALMGYLGAVAGATTMAQLADDDRIMAVARRAFLAESGGALCRKYADLGDPLFTSDGFAAYAEDLLERMTNPYLNDAIARVGRDPARKLGYDDRLFGTMRLALDADITPVNLAMGAAAGLLFWLDQRGVGPAHAPGRERVAGWMADLWADGATDHHRATLVDLTADAMPRVWAMRK